MPQIRRYRRENGRVPFDEWFAGLRSKLLKAEVAARLDMLELGNFGDCNAVGQGVIELRIHSGGGFRIYCGRHGNDVVILLSAGGKSTQAADILRARRFWADWKRRNG